MRLVNLKSIVFVVGAMCAAASLTGCATASADDGQSREVRAPVETVTGSNLVRRAKRSNEVVEIDPEAFQSSLRGQTRNSGQ